MNRSFVNSNELLKINTQLLILNDLEKENEPLFLKKTQSN